jgi:transposase-like protein
MRQAIGKQHAFANVAENAEHPPKTLSNPLLRIPRKIRWSATEGKPVCPECGGVDYYEYRRPTGLLRFRCKACGKNYSLTSGTLFASHKAPLRAYLAAIAVFMNEVKGRKMGGAGHYTRVGRKEH